MTKQLLAALALAAAVQSSPAAAQETSFIYRLGKDTVGVERYTRTPSRLTGEVVTRQGAAVIRVQYDATIAPTGKVSAVNYKVLGPDGNPIAGRPREIRYEIVGDSAKRTIVWADSTSNRTLAAANAVPFVGPAYGMLELAALALRKGGAPTATYPVLGLGTGANIGTIQLNAAAGDTIRQANGFAYVFDRSGALRAVDGNATTQKIMGSRATGSVNIAALAAGMKPMGVLSARGFSRGHFQTTGPGGVIMVDYGRPQVRDRTVWGGVLIPLDTIWRLGANEATHFATGRDIDFGNGVIVPAGLYTLFLYNAKTGPMLAVSKQVGQWGTAYDQARDVARIPLTMAATPEFVEEFTITIRQAAPSRGSIEIAWGSQMAATNFTVK